MKAKIFLLAIFAISVSLYSCKKDSDSSEAAKPLIQKTTYEDQSYSTYQYDGTRMIKITNSDGTYSTLEYATNTVTVKGFSATNVLENTEVFTLNSKGYAVSAVSSSAKKKSASSRNMSPILFPMYSMGSTTITYEYDANGHMTKAIYGDGTGQETITYTISNGNSVGYSDATTGSQTYTSTSSFFTDKTNTIGFENMGVTFFGKGDVNLIQSVTDSYSGNPITHNYTYQYDSQNRVVNQTITTSGFNSTSTSYTYK